MKKLMYILAFIAVAIGGAMYVIGTNNSRLTELKDFFYIPIIVGAVFSAAGRFMKSK